MEKIIFSFLFLVIFGLTKVNAQKSDATNEVLLKIRRAEVAAKKKKELNQQDLNEIVCLTNIETKKGEGNYLGISFFPSESEIQLWKDWFKKNKDKIAYSKNSDLYNKEVYIGKRKVIEVEYEKGKFRNNVCDEDKDLKDWLENRK